MVQNPAIVQASSVGARETNEDRVGHWTAPDAVLLAVADGLGGHMHGEVAAQLAIDILGASFQGDARPKLEDPGQFFGRALAAAHAAILRETEKRRFAETPRTVIAACVVQDGHVFWTHVGDCRFYLLRTGRILARSRDHTVVQRLVDEGRIREEAAATHPHRNRLLRCLGGYQMPALEPVASARLTADDILLLCSDGFWGPLTQRQLMHALLSRPLAEAIPELVALAESSAGPECDNVSVVAMAWNQPE
ncbi:MAG TPA: PP2C family serine/threonine-protein phosphatase [Burkholderiales bacterium]|nr:PP2C family serine/threonine-protein phosphatase [Burkholderiales bacterium]